jgi:hypothetical protein
MSDTNKMELVVELNPQQANAALGGINKNLSEVERAAVQAARNSSTAMDGMTASMVKGATAGNLLADSIKNVVNWVKEWSIGAAEATAHVERLQAGMMALSRANGVSGESARKAVEAIKLVGFTSADAVAAVNRLMISRIGVQNAGQIAQIARNAAGVGNVPAPEALEGITRAVEFGQARGLRTVGINVSFTKEIAAEEEKLGRTLTQNEEVRTRYNAVVRESAKLTGVAAEVDKTAEGQLAALGREVDALKESLGASFQEAFKGAIQLAREFVGYLKDNPDVVWNFVKAIIAIGAAIAGAALYEKLVGITLAVKGLTVALAANPIGAAVGLAVIGGAMFYSQYSDQQQAWKDREASLHDRGFLKQRGGLGERASDSDLASISKFTMVNGVISMKPGAGVDPGDDLSGTKIKVSEMRKAEIETAKQAAEAWGKERSELAKIGVEHDSLIEKYKKEGLLNDTIRKNIDSRMMAEWTGMNKIWNLKQAQLNMEKGAKGAEDLLGMSEINARGGPLGPEGSAAAGYGYGTWQEAQADKTGQLQVARDARTRSLDLAQAQSFKLTLDQTVKGKVALEQAKLDIEIDFLKKSQALQEQAIIARYGEDANGADPAMRAAIEARRDQEVQRSQSGLTDAVNAARQSTAVKQAQDVQSEYQKHFDAIKNSAGTLFDALISHTKTFGQTLMATLRTAILTPIKEAVSTWIAGMLMGNRALTGGGGGSGGGGGGIQSAALSAMLGGGASGGGGYPGGMGGGGGAMTPPFWGGGSGFLSMLSGAGGLITPAGTNGGLTTPPFLPGSGGDLGYAQGMYGAPYGAMGAGGTAGGGGAMGGLGQIGLLANLKGSLSKLGGLGGAFSSAHGGVNGAWGGAMLAGGGMLAYDGLRRGGALGMVETAGGGALIGAKFGGPIGALIGGAIGLGAGALRWALGGKSPEDKMKDDVKSAYGLSIDTEYAKSLVQRAGGIDYRVFLQTPAIQQEMQLYRQMTKQAGGGNLNVDNVARGVNLTESGGSLYQAPTYGAGGAFGYQSTLQSMGGFQTLTPNVTVVANMDGRATTNFLGGAAVNATAQSQGRTGLASNLLSPAMGPI